VPLVISTMWISWVPPAILTSTRESSGVHKLIFPQPAPCWQRRRLALVVLHREPPHITYS